MLHFIVKFGQGHYPSGQDALGALKCFKPLQRVVVGAENDRGPNEVVTEVLQARDHRKKLPPSGAVITLRRIHNAGEKGDRALHSVHHGGEYSAHRDIRRIGVKNKNLVWLGISQDHCLGEGALKVLEGLLGFRGPVKANPFLGQCREWFRDAGKIFNKFTIVGRKSKESTDIADTLGHWPVLDGLNFLLLRVNALSGDHVAQEGDALSKEGALRRLNFKAHTVKAGENSVQSFQKFLLGRRIHYDVIKVA